MPRPPRGEEEDAIWHVFARGNRQAKIFTDDHDRRLYLRLLGREVRRRRWRCLAYCLMHNHVHLLVETPDPNLAAGMQQLHGVYAQTFNEAHGWSGHVFQGRYGAKRIETDEQLLVTVRYIARNPVEAGLCEEPAGWRWSSHAAVTGGAAKPVWLNVERLLGYFGINGGMPCAVYEAFVR